MNPLQLANGFDRVELRGPPRGVPPEHHADEQREPRRHQRAGNVDGDHELAPEPAWEEEAVTAGFDS